MLIPDLLTARLRLVAITPDALDVQEKAPHFLGDLLDATIPAGWPNKDWEPHVYSFMRSQFQEHPETIGWHRYVLLPEPDHFVLIGALGSHPLGDTEAEFGYGILEPWQNNGYATEASEALIQHLFDSGRQKVKAKTYPQLIASLRVMQKCGMQPDGDGDEPGTIQYTIEKN